MSEPKLFSNCLKCFFVPEILDAESGESADENEESANAHIAVTRLQQLLSVFLQAYSMVSSSKYQQVVVDSIEHVVADLTVLCRDEIAAVTVLPKLANHLMSMCENQQVMNSESSSYIACCSRLAASIAREALKLGNSKLEKATNKELIKVLVSLSPKSWVTSQTAASMYKVTKCIARNCTLDKALKKSLDSFSCACAKEAVSFKALSSAHAESVEQENMDDSVAYAVYEQEEQRKLEGDVFYSYAPGIADLVELIAADDDSDIEAAAAATTTTAALQENDSNADDSEAEEKEEDEEESVPTPGLMKASKGAKAKEAEDQVQESITPSPLPVSEIAESALEKPKRKRVAAKAPVIAKPESAKSMKSTAATPTPTKARASRANAKAATKTVEDEDKVVSKPRRARAVKTSTDKNGADDLAAEVDMENVNPQAV